MLFHDRQSPVAKCPLEVWCIVLNMATTYTFPPHLCEDLVRISDLLDEHTPDELQPIYKARADTVHDVLALALVCREWSAIVTPFLLDWMLITDDQQLRHLAGSNTLTKTVGYRMKGSWVRRLEIAAGTAYDGQHITDIVDWVVDILETCTRLEEFISRCGLVYACPDVLSALVASCGQTLTSVTLPGPWEIRDAESLSVLLDGCPRLTTLKIACPSTSAGPPSRMPAGPLPLRAFLWYITANIQVVPVSAFPTFFASLDLPHLRHIELAFDNHGAWTEDLDTAVLPPIVHALRPHGSRLTSLCVKEIYRNFGHGLVGRLLELCPGLEDLEVDVASSDLGIVTTPHQSVRRIRCNKFIILPNDDEPDVLLNDHFSNVKSFVEDLTRENFPKLERIRFMDVYPADEARRPLDAARYLNALYAFYREMTRHIGVICSERGVRFEDHLGNVVGEDFSLPAWFYRLVAEGQYEEGSRWQA